MRQFRAPTRKESEDERKTSKEWRDLGYFECKIEKANHTGLPDRFYASRALGVRFWCEWKRVGKDAEEHQSNRHEWMRDNDEIVIVAHSREEFWREVRRLQREGRT